MSNEVDERRLPADETVARYVGGSHFDPGTGGINGSAFERTPKDVDGVSFARRSVHSTVEADDRDAIRRVAGSRLKLGKNAVFAELKVGAALDVLREFEQDVFFREDRLAAEGDKLADPAHALLIGFPFKGEQVGSLKSEVAGDRLRRCVSACFPAVKTD